ncbi:MAG: VIT1/CCC1 transporter family protein [Chloroflexota bacterium]
MSSAQSLENLKLEQDAIALYDALATIEQDPRRAAAFRHIAGNERRHAGIWADKLREAGVAVPPVGAPRLRVRLIIALARMFGTRAVSDLVKALEGDEEDTYEGQDATPEIAAIANDEREHAEIWRRLESDAWGSRIDPRRGSRVAARGVDPATSPVDGRIVAAAAATAGGSGASGGAAVAVAPETPEQITSRERWHRSARSGTLRAVIFGVSDGLVSNLSLVMGVAGAAAAHQGSSFVLLAGIAGLLAGAFSMAAGEYISMQSQRELFERQIALERAELEAMPEEEQRELAAVYRSKGFTTDEANRIAERLFRDPQTALDTLVREELGLDPDELGSPWGAAGGSFLAFAIGAAIPVIPYLLTTGSAAFVASIVLSAIALFAVGAGVSLLTGRGILMSGSRQVAIGAAAAIVTYTVGSIIGVSVGG